MHPVVELINIRTKSLSTSGSTGRLKVIGKDEAESRIRLLNDLGASFNDYLRKQENQSDLVDPIQSFYNFDRLVKSRARYLTKKLNRVVSSEKKLKLGVSITAEQLESIKSCTIACLKELTLLQKLLSEYYDGRPKTSLGTYQDPDMGKTNDVQAVKDLPDMKAFLDVSAKLGTTNDEIDKAATAAAIEQITWREKNLGLEQCIKDQTGFSAHRIDKTVIGDYLDNGRVVFEVDICVNKVLKSAVLYLFESSFEIMVEQQTLFPGQRTVLGIEIHYDCLCPPQFILKYPGGSFTCAVQNIRLRDEIVVTVKAFMIKGPDNGKMKGLQVLRFFPSSKEYGLTFAKLDKRAEISKASVAAAVELTLRRENDLGLEQCSRTDTGFSADRIDKDVIANYLDEDHIFNVEVCVNDVWESATLHFLDGPLKIMVDGQTLVSAPHSIAVWVEMHNESRYPPELSVEFPDASYTCRTWDARLRDEIVVAFKAFMIRHMFHKRFRVWTKPSERWLKLNTDAISGFRLENAWGIGGLIRDESGNWVNGFWGRLVKEATITELEFISLKSGLRLAMADKESGELWMEIETNSQFIEDILKSETDIPDDSGWRDLAIECRELLARLGGYKVTTVGTWATEAPYKLARKGIKLDGETDFVESYEPPKDLLQTLSNETY